MIFLLRLLASLPLPVLHHIGAIAGWLVYGLAARYRSHVRENVRRACGTDAARVQRRAIGQAGRQVLELPRVWFGELQGTLDLIAGVSGDELLAAARARGDGIMLIAPHLGCFEIIPRYVASRMPITVMYRPPKQRWLAPIIEAGRCIDNVSQAPADMIGVRHLLRALHRREAIGLLPDQAPQKGEGIWCDFFGRPAYTMTLAARLSMHAHVSVLFVYAQRLPSGAGFHMHFRAPPVPLEGTVTQRVAAINRGVEAIVRGLPEQYMWGYNRYKVPAGASAVPNAGDEHGHESSGR